MGFKRSPVRIRPPRPPIRTEPSGALHMPENTQRAHLIGFPANRSPEHSHYVQGYLYACEAEGKTRATVESYRWNLSSFLRAVPALGLPRQPGDVSREHIRRYLAHLRSGGAATSTVNDYLAALRLWFKGVVLGGVVGRGPNKCNRKGKTNS